MRTNASVCQVKLKSLFRNGFKNKMTIDDLAEAAEARFRAAALSERKPELKAKGTCYYCDAKIDGIFCDGDCREAYEFEERQRKNNPSLRK